MADLADPRTITKVLVANRGEIASRVFRTCRALGRATVAVYSDPDRELPFVQDAAESVPLPGASPAETYLRGDLIVAAALRTGADAIHPGYGFLSENAAFAQQVIDAGLIWIGPSPASMTAMASKVAAKECVAAFGVPVLPSRNVTGLDDDKIRAGGAAVGYPLLVKASAGGGGRGMRIVRSPDDLVAGVRSASREAESAFGDGTVFVERLVEAPRHIEIQVFGDTLGTIVSLFERDCSVQRRYQKVVEESPCVALDPDVRSRMFAAAVAAARAVEYTGAGTVEFVLGPDGEFAFLEMNTRLQVEHRVTELVTGLDLVALQISVAEGHPLPAEVLAAETHGHAIEVRLYAEDPTRGYQPATGTLEMFAIDESIAHVDSTVRSGTVVSPYYDAMLAKVIVHASTRCDAARALAGVLQRARIHGLTTNRDLLVRVLRHPDFLAARVDTGFLERHDPAKLGAPVADRAADHVHAIAATLALAELRRRASPVLATLDLGWRNNPSLPCQDVWDGSLGPLNVKWRPAEASGGFGGYEVAVNDLPMLVQVHGLCAVVEEARPDVRAYLVDLVVEGVRRSVNVLVGGEPESFDNGFGSLVAYVDSGLGSGELRARARFARPDQQATAGSMDAPMPGIVNRILVATGDVVVAGQPVLVLEAMKMEHTVASPRDGRIGEVRVVTGTQVAAGDVLVVLADERDEPEEGSST
jgi:propionyl-CoA carboxylase alpha chain